MTFEVVPKTKCIEVACLPQIHNITFRLLLMLPPPLQMLPPVAIDGSPCGGERDAEGEVTMELEDPDRYCARLVKLLLFKLLRCGVGGMGTLMHGWDTADDMTFAPLVVVVERKSELTGVGEVGL